MGTSFNPLNIISNIKALATPDDKIENPAAKPKPPTIIQGGSYKSFADLQHTGYDKDKKSAQFAAARSLKDPSKAPTPSLRLQAVSGKLQRVFDSQTYKSLSPENKVLVQSHYYDKYLVPAFKENGIVAPSKADWIENHAASVGTSEEKPTADKAYVGLSTAIKGVGDTTRFTANVLKYSIGNGVIPGFKEGTRDSVLSKTIDRNIDKMISFADDLQKAGTNYDSTFAVAHDPVSWLANFAGSAIGDAPAYMVGGGFIGKAAEGIVPSFAEKAAVSKGFKVGYTALKAATEVFGVSEGEGKGFKDSAINAAGALLIAGGVTKAALKFKGAQLAMGGEPLARTIADDASKAEGLDEEKGLKALVNKNDPDYKQAVTNERGLREAIARQFHPEKAEAAGERSIYRNLSKGQRAKINQHIAALGKQSAELMPIVNPEIQTMANAKELAVEAKANPEFAARMSALEKKYGINVAETLTEMQAKKVSRDTGIGSPASDLHEAFGEPEGDMFGENLRGTKGAKTVSNKQLLNPLLPESGFIEGTRKYLEPNTGSKSVGGYENFENPKDHLLWVANHSSAPDAVKNRAFGLLAKNYGLSRTEAGVTRAAGWLAEHRADLARTGLLDKEGNIFRSTKTTQRRYGTPYQKQLYTEDSIAADLKSLNKLFKAKPELKKTITPLIEMLTDLRNRSNNPLTSRYRRMVQDQVQELLSRYK